jgi:hypothetical protein
MDWRGRVSCSTRNCGVDADVCVCVCWWVCFRRLDLTVPTQYQGGRRLLKEGIVGKAKSGRKLTLVLCNDILVLIESRNLYRMVSWSLSQREVLENGGRVR